MNKSTWLKRAVSLTLTSALTLALASCQSGNVSTGTDLNNDDVSALSRKKDGQKKWTFMVHLAADNNLYPFGLEDINEMEAGLKNLRGNDVNVVVLFDGTQKGDSAVYEIKADPAGMNKEIISPKVANPVAAAGSEIDSGNKELAGKFLDWATTTYPADHYAYVVWNHGAGWQREGKGKNGQILKPIKNATSYSSAGELITKEFAWDDNGSHMSTVDLNGILDPVAKKIGRKLDILDFDACLMAHVEVAYQMRNSVDYLVASEKTEPGAGNPYGDIFSALGKNTGMNGKEFASTIVKEYGKYIVAVNGYQGTSEYSENELRVKAEVNMSGKPNIGDKVEYLSSNGSFIKGILKEINDGKYTIQTGNYDNVSVEAKNLNSVAKQQEIALQKIQDEYYKTFWTDVSKYSESVKYVASAYNPDYSGTYIHASFTPEMIKKISSDLDALDKLCKSKYPDLENPTYLTASQKYDLAYLGGDWRKMAEKRKDIIQKSVLIFVEEQTKSILNSKQGANDEYYIALKDGFNTIKKDVEKTLKELKIEDSMKSVGLSFKPDWNDYKKDYDKKLAKFNEDLKSRPPVFADDLGNSYSLKDGSVEAAAKKEALSQVTNGSVIQSGVKSSNWQVEKNKLGIPTYMTKYAGVMLSSKDYRSCIIVNTGVYKDYTGGGTYGAPYAKAVTTKYVRCK